jgi:hypothetical protein
VFWSGLLTLLCGSYLRLIVVIFIFLCTLRKAGFAKISVLVIRLSACFNPCSKIVVSVEVVRDLEKSIAFTACSPPVTSYFLPSMMQPLVIFL